MRPSILRESLLDERLAFVREHTALARPALVPELVLHTATELTPLWRATQEWLGSVGIEVPFWSVPWAGGQALARWLLDHPETVRGRRVIDLGSGSGLVGLACARAGAASVRAVDVDPLAEAACVLNMRENALVLEVECRDIVDVDPSAVAALAARTDVLVAGDVWYDRAASARFGPWLAAVARAGVLVLTGDPGRAYVPAEAVELARLEVPTSMDLESRPSRTTRILELR